MSPQQILDLPSICLVGLVGLVMGGLASYLANLLLHSDGLVSYPKTFANCNHRGRLIEALPLVSFFLVKDKCEYCRSRVKWQYPLAEIVLAVIFVMLFSHFGFRFYTIGMATFATVLLTICITDFRTKIIPHEITYPSILLGIVFGIITKADIFGALAGIGISYILFDFLAFYGLKIYLWLNPPTLALPNQFVSTEVSNTTKGKKIKARVSSWLSQESYSLTERVARKPFITPKLYCKGMPIEELEVLGGGDAVLSALISAWLGWQKLVFALIMGFIVGTAMGAIYVFIELWKERLIKTVVIPTLISVTVLCTLATIMLGMLANSLNEPFYRLPYFYVWPAAIFAGFLLGVIIAGSKISKPFPFGPALAVGALMAVFRDNQ